MAKPEPKLLLTGTFGLYETPDGGYHIAYRPQDAEEDQHLEFPGAMVKMARRMQSMGGITKMFKGLG